MLHKTLSFFAVLALLLSVFAFANGTAYASVSTVKPSIGIIGNYGSVHNGKNSNYCLGISGGRTTNGANSVIWSCNGHNDQQWIATNPHSDAGGTYYTIKDLNSGLCLGLYQGSAFEGAVPIQWSCNNNQDQQWYVLSNSYTPIINRVNQSLCLGVQGGNVFSGAAPVLWACNGNSDQSWL